MQLPLDVLPSLGTQYLAEQTMEQTMEQTICAVTVSLATVTVSLSLASSLRLNQSPGKNPGQAAHHGQHDAHVRRPHRRIGLEHGHVHSAEGLAADGGAGVFAGHAVG